MSELIDREATVKQICKIGEMLGTCHDKEVTMVALFIQDDKSAFPTVERPQWIPCSDRLPTAEDGERVIVHICFEKPACEYVFVPWKTVGFEYQVGHIDAWLAIPKYEKEVRER